VKPLRLVLLLLTLAVAPAAAAPQYPALTGRVVDDAGLLSASARSALEAKLADFERARKIQLVVATLPSLQGYSIEEYGVGLGRAWGIGEKGKNTGVVLLVAPKERAVRIEVGYGLEGTLTDALTSAIINQRIVPLFRAGSFEAGILAGVDGILGVLDPTYKPSEPVAEVAPARNDGSFPSLLIVAVLVVAALYMNRYRRTYRRGFGGFPIGFGGGSRGSGGTGFSGGGFSGGGGSFGGGGASGSW
jgi:uncharacterized protein